MARCAPERPVRSVVIWRLLSPTDQGGGSRQLSVLSAARSCGDVGTKFKRRLAFIGGHSVSL